MAVLSDQEIRERNIFTPFEDSGSKPGIITFGVSSYGYDIRCSPVFQVFDPIGAAGRVIDPKNFDPNILRRIDTSRSDGTCIIPPNSFALTNSLERIKIPRDCLGIVTGKSTLARCGIIINVTPLEPEWEGHLTIEISNTAPIPAKVYAGEGIAQIYLLTNEGGKVCLKSYKDKKGRYQNQPAEVALPSVIAADS